MNPIGESASVPLSDQDAFDLDLLQDTTAYLERQRQGSRSSSSPPDPSIDAWNRFYRLCDPLIRQTIGAYHFTEADRSDCVQETWKEVVANLSRFPHDPGRGRLRAWILTLARNKAVDVIRGRARHPAFHLDDQTGCGARALDADPAAEFERHRTRDLVRSVLAELSRRISERNYRVLYLRAIEERSVLEVAALMGLTQEQVRCRYCRVKQKFQDLFELSIKNALPGPPRY